MCSVGLSLREHTMSGINQFHITHAGGIEGPALTRLDIQRVGTKKKPPCDGVVKK